ncbi:MAG: rRNA pseudouridine synthase [Planctomycetes bacterium]|nr:rRNA pseudouridine synthase [Planctomycetota bacterium]
MDERGIRLQKYMASCGVASRRACEDLIVQGRVSVDGETVRVLGTRVDPSRQTVRVDGEPLRTRASVYYLVNKPRGYICSNAPEFEPKRVVDLVSNAPAGVFAAGRLDVDSDGLVFVTNDGAAANRITHPRFGVPKTYRVLARDRIPPEGLDRIRAGMFLAEGKVVPRRVEEVSVHENRTVAEVVLAEGLNRVVRRLFAKAGYPVKRLTRVSIGPFFLGDLPPGKSRRLDPSTVTRLLEQMGEGPEPGEGGGEKPFRRRRAGRPEARERDGRPVRPPGGRGDAPGGGGRGTGRGKTACFMTTRVLPLSVLIRMLKRSYFSRTPAEVDPSRRCSFTFLPP